MIRKKVMVEFFQNRFLSPWNRWACTSEAGLFWDTSSRTPAFNLPISIWDSTKPVIHIPPGDGVVMSVRFCPILLSPPRELSTRHKTLVRGGGRGVLQPKGWMGLWVKTVFAGGTLCGTF